MAYLPTDFVQPGLGSEKVFSAQSQPLRVNEVNIQDACINLTKSSAKQRIPRQAKRLSHLDVEVA